MIKYLQTSIRWLTGCLIFFMLSCSHKEKLNPLILSRQDSLQQIKIIAAALHNIALAKKSIQPGDLITRTGNDFTSRSICSLNRRNQTYSHCGIASIENDSLFVYHALGGEWNPAEKLRRDSWEIFTSPLDNKKMGVFTFNWADSSNRHLLSVVRTHYKNELKFDMDFDLKTDDRMYCAEFIYKSFAAAGNGQLTFNKSKIGSFEFIGVDDIFLHPLFKKKLEIVYK